MINFFDSAFEGSRPISEKCAVLESECHYGGFRTSDSESFDVVKKRINVYLGCQEKRFEGLMLLKTVSDQCPVEIFQQNALSWAQMVLKVLQHHGESSGSRKLAYKILKEVLRSMLSSPRLASEASNSLLPALIDTLLESSVDDEWIQQTAECLSACMKYFPNACGLKKDKIEEFLILLLDRWELKEFEPIAECFSSLPACGVDGNDRTVSFQKMWSEQFKQFIDILNAILDLYDGVENGCGDLKICSAKQLPPIPEEPVSAVLRLAHRFKAFCLCLSKMLVSASSIRAVVPADALLMFLGRTFSVSPSNMERNLLIYAALPSLHLAALTVLESFILSCDQHLMSASHLVSKFLTQAIKSTCLKNTSKDSLNLVRCSAYEVLQRYTERYKLFSVAETHREFLLSVMIRDIKPSVTEVKLDRTPNSFQIAHAMETAECNKHRSSSRTGTEALKALKEFVTYGNLDLRNFEEIYNSLVNTLLEIQEKPLDLPVPYSDENYRLALYSLLQTLSVSLHSQNFTCLPATISLVTIGLEDASSVVRSKCQEILDATDVLVNTVKVRIHDSASINEESEEKMIFSNEQTFNQISRSAGIYPVAHHVMTNEHSNANESSACVEMVNGVLPVSTVREAPPSQNVDSSKSFPSELSEQPERQDSGGEISVQAESNHEPGFYVNSNADSPSEPEVEEEEEMDVEEEEEEEEEFKDSYVNQNGFSSEDECLSEEEEELPPSKRPSSRDVQSNGPSVKKVVLNDTEDHSDPDVSMMLQDFIPTSPDAHT